MTFNKFSLNKVNVCYIKGTTNIENLNEIKKEMAEQNIDTKRVDVLNITTHIEDYGSCETEYDRYKEISDIKLKYNYIIHYTLR